MGIPIFLTFDPEHILYVPFRTALTQSMFVIKRLQISYFLMEFLFFYNRKKALFIAWVYIRNVYKRI